MTADGGGGSLPLLAVEPERAFSFQASKPTMTSSEPGATYVELASVGIVTDAMRVELRPRVMR